MIEYFKMLNHFLIENNLFYNDCFIISSLDNPGWTVSIDLSSTNYVFDRKIIVDIDKGKNDWIYCNHNKLNSKVLEGVGDSTKLNDILKYMCDVLIGSNKDFAEYDMKYSGNNEDFKFSWLQQWYVDWCKSNYDWFNEDFDITIIKGKEKKFWDVKLELTDTKLSGVIFNKHNVILDCSSEDFCEYESDGRYFIGKAGQNNLLMLLSYFKNWALNNGYNF